MSHHLLLIHGSHRYFYSASLQANLPPFERIPKAPITSYNNIGGTEFMGIIKRIYSSVIQWLKNLFQTPNGSAGKAYIRLKTQWLKHFNENTTFKGIALKVFMMLPGLMLRKPYATSKSRDHSKALERRSSCGTRVNSLKFWEKGLSFNRS